MIANPQLKQQLQDRAFDAVLAAALVLLVLGMGLWHEARQPRLPGTHPAPHLHSLVTNLGYATAQKNRVSYRYLNALAASREWTWIGAMSLRRPVVMRDTVEEVTVDMVTGPLFAAAGVALTGPGLSTAAVQLPMSKQPVREVVLSEARAVEWFGSAEAALGQILALGTVQWSLIGGAPAEFRIVGVAQAPFQGINIERPAELWIGVNGWHDLIFPAEQFDDFTAAFGPSSLLLNSERASQDALAVQAALRKLGEARAEVRLVPGVGYHPERRARFAAIANDMLHGLALLSLLLLISIVAQAMLSAERRSYENRVRRFLGEPAWRRWWRQIERGLVSALSVLFLTSIGLWLMPAIFDGGLPVERAAARGWNESADMLGIIAGFFLVLFPAMATALQRWRAERWLGVWVAALLGGLMLVQFSGVLVGSLIVARLQSSLQHSHPVPTLDAAVLPIVEEQGAWMFSRKDMGPLEAELAQVGLALASVGPDGGEIPSERVRIRHQHGDDSTVVTINAVSANYFEVLGIPVQFLCGPPASWSADAVYVNRRWLQEHGLTADAAIQIVTESGRERPVCAVVADAQVLNARAGQTAMVYESLRERRAMAVTLSAAMPTPEQEATLRRSLGRHVPEARPGQAATVRERLDAQLQQERQLVRLNVMVLVVMSLVTALSALLLGRAAVLRQSRSLGTQRALGADLWLLIARALVGRSPLVWAALLLCGLGVVVATVRRFELSALDLAAPLLAATVLTALILLSVALLLRLRVDESRLIAAIQGR